MSNPCLLLEVSDADQWEPWRGGKRLPLGHGPTQLHPTREIAESEALRLAKRNPGKRFAVLECKSITTKVKITTHVTLAGRVVIESDCHVLSEVDEDEIPF
ncbi:MAG TPA: hypothetical protein VGC24_03070 [Burkholderiaceae bacterium]